MLDSEGGGEEEVSVEISFVICDAMRCDAKGSS